MRSDRAWVDWLAEHGPDGGTMTMRPIVLTHGEIVELRQRDGVRGAR